MPKIAMIGAGSLIFCKTLSHDILATPALRGSEIRLMGPRIEKVDSMRAFLQETIDENNLPATVMATTNRRDAIRDADYVIVMIQVGGVEAFRLDYEIPLQYGVDQCIADSLGPGGVMRAQRAIPVLIDIARDVQELAAPGVLLINYANPMGANCAALATVPDLPFIGLCHGVQTTLDLIARYVDTPKDQIDHVCAGINHMAWFLGLRDKRDGRDLNPILRERIEKPEYYVNEKVRAEVMRHFGYFMTESTGHLSEYLPWFRSAKRMLDLYCDQPGFGGASGAYYHYCADIAKKYENIDYLALESRQLGQRSVEYCSYILEAKETDNTFRLNGNVRNDGYITNLPEGCCVEVPVFVDARGLHPVRVGDLPTQCAALNQSNVTLQTLAVEAALTGDPERVMQAIAVDPLTSAVCSLKEVREMTAELMEAQAEWLPGFEGRRPRPAPTIAIPDDVEPVDVPLDPALAIANRFGELAEKEVE